MKLTWAGALRRRAGGQRRCAAMEPVSESQMYRWPLQFRRWRWLSALAAVPRFRVPLGERGLAGFERHDPRRDLAVSGVDRDYRDRC